MTSFKIQAMATIIANDGFSSKTYRECWRKDFNITYLAFQSFAQEQQIRIIEGLKKQLAQSSFFYCFENSRIQACLKFTKVLLNMSQYSRKTKLKQQEKKALAVRKPAASKTVLRITSPDTKASRKSDKEKAKKVDSTDPTGGQLEGEDELDHLLKKNK